MVDFDWRGFISGCRTALVLHHDDLDGRVAGRVACMALSQQEDLSVSCTETSYDHMVPWSNMMAADLIVVVDFSYTPVVLDELSSYKKKIIWIDHHRTSLERAGLGPGLSFIRSTFPTLSGGNFAVAYLSDGEPSAAKLAWEFFFPSDRCPEVLDIVSAYDSWTHQGDERTLDIVAALDWRMLEGDAEIAFLLSPFNVRALSDRLADLRNEGEMIRRIDSVRAVDYLKRTGFRVCLDGHFFWAANSGGMRINSLHLDELLKSPGRFWESVEGLMVFRRGMTGWSVSLYRSAESKVDMGGICRQYGGGGHPGAAGFIVSSPPEEGLWEPPLR